MIKKPTAASKRAALEAAQNLVYEAWEAGSAKQRVALAQEALATSPLCADAHVILARHAERKSDAELDHWRRGVEAGEKALGKKAFTELEGHFWGVHETRPYMRARAGLADALWTRGEKDAAIDHLRDMLRLNPGDNQGLRYVFAGRLLDAGRDAELAAHFDAYPDDGGAAWEWTKALAAFRSKGDTAASRKLLTEAIATNKHVPAYMLGDKPTPKQMPSSYSMGGEDEAVLYVVEGAASWAGVPGALDWLRTQAGTPTAGKKRSPRGASAS